MSQGQLASAMGVSRQTINSIEQERYTPSLPLALALARYFETTVEAMGEAMARFNEEVKQTVPADRLLVWYVSDGWEPLCDFLNVPVPAMPFPHLNDTREFNDRVIDGALLTLQQWRTQHQEEPVSAT